MSEAEPEASEGDPSSQAIRTAVEIAIRLGAIALLVGWCLTIVAPFVGIVVWALIIAISAEDGFERACGWLGGRRVLTATLAVTALLVAIFVPAVLFSETLVSGAQKFAERLAQDEVHVPPPPTWVEALPFVGETVHEAWVDATENLRETLARLGPQLRAVSRWLLGAAGNVGAGLLQLIGSVLIAGVMLVRSESRRRAFERFALRMVGEERGHQLVELATGTVRSVVQGIVGVALLQSLMAGTGFVVAGIPGAGVWALLVLVAAVIQLPVALVLIPPVVLGFSMLGGPAAAAFLVWCVAVSLVDNVLKPILFGRGVKLPSLVIFLGAIGGMLTMGIIGLFLGAVVLALGYELFNAWLSEAEAQARAEA